MTPFDFYIVRLVWSVADIIQSIIIAHNNFYSTNNQAVGITRIDKN